MKKRLSLILSSLLVFSATAALVIKNVNHQEKLVKTDATEYVLTLDETKAIGSNTPASGVAAINNNGWEINFEYESLSASAGNFASIQSHSFLKNVDAIHGMKSIVINFSGDDLNLYYGFEINSDNGMQVIYDLGHMTSISNGSSFNFNNHAPSHFLVVAGNTAAVISSIIITYTCEVGDSKNIDDSYVLAYGSEGDAAGLPGFYRYWNDQNWCGTNVTISSSYYDLVNSELSITYSVTGSSCDWGLQVFFKNPALTVGETYRLSFEIENDNVSKDVQINGKTISMSDSSVPYSVNYKETTGVSFKLVVPTAGGESGTLVLSNIQWTLALGSPENVALSDANVLTFDSVLHATSYEAQIVRSDFSLITGCDSFVVESGDNISSEIPGGLEEGIYYVLVRAKANGFLDSEWSLPTATFSIGAVDPIPNPDVDTNLTNGDEGLSVSNPGTLVEWHDQGWCGSNVAISQATVKNRVITVTFTSSGACGFGLQIFFKNSTLTNGNEYRISMDVNAANACNVRLQLNNIDFEHALIAGDNSISQVYTEGTHGSASMSFIIPVSGGTANTFVISNITWTPVA